MSNLLVKLICYQLHFEEASYGRTQIDINRNPYLFLRGDLEYTFLDTVELLNRLGLLGRLGSSLGLNFDFTLRHYLQTQLRKSISAKEFLII